MEIQWSLVIFTLLTGAGGWMLVGVAANEFIKKSKKDSFAITLIALVLVIVGGFVSVTHLSHPSRIMNALSNPASGIFVEAVLVGIIAVCGIVQLILYKRKVAGAAKVFAVLSALFGVVCSFMAGESYTVMASRAAWDTLLLPLAYLATAAPMGLGLYWALACPDEENGSSVFALVSGIAGGVGAVSVAAYAMAAGIFVGDAMPYAACAIVLDVVACALGVVGAKKPGAAFAWAAVACACVAGALLRILMWVAGVGPFGFFG